MNSGRIAKPTLLMLALAALVIPSSALAYTPLTDSVTGLTVEPDPYIRGNVSIANHHNALCGTDVLCYEDDSGNARNLAANGAHLNPDVPAPIQFQPSHVNCQYYGKDTTSLASIATQNAWCSNITYPASTLGLNWLDPAQWTATKQANSTFARELRNGADVLHIKNLGNAPGGDYHDDYTLDFPDITTDIAKLRFVIGVEIVSLSHPSGVSFNAYDTNLSALDAFVAVPASTGVKALGATNAVIANGTGTTFWDELVTTGSPVQGGVKNGVGKIVINLHSDSAIGPADLYVYALGLQVKRYDFGLDALGQDVYNMTYQGQATPPGYVSLSQFSPNFAYTNAKDLKVAYEIRASTLSATNVTIIGKDLPAGGAYSYQNDYRFDFFLPKMIDLTYAGDETISSLLNLPGAQRERLVVNGVDVTKQYANTAKGTIVTLLSAVPQGLRFEVEYVNDLTDAQRDTVTGVGFLWLSPGNPISKFFVMLGSVAVIGGLVGVALVRRRQG